MMFYVLFKKDMDTRIVEKIKERIATNPYVNFLGIHFSKIEEGVVEARMPLRDEQRQYSGVTHGGVLAALADTIAGFAAYTMTPLEKDVDIGCISANARFIATISWSARPRGRSAWSSRKWIDLI